MPILKKVLNDSQNMLLTFLYSLLTLHFSLLTFHFSLFTSDPPPTYVH